MTNMNKNNFTIYKLPNYNIFKNEDGTGTFKCESYTGSIDSVLKRLEKNKGYHLRIDPDQPCIMYGDLDHVPSEDIFEKFINLLSKVFDVDVNKIAYTFSNKNHELSYHWSIPSIQASPKLLKTIFAKSKYDEYKSYIDLTIYNSQWFRLPNQTNSKKPLAHTIMRGELQDFIFEYIENCDEELEDEEEIVHPPTPKIMSVSVNSDVTNDITNCLQCISSYHYDDWSTVAFVLNNELGYNGLSILDEWSSTSSNYNKFEVEKFYKNIKPKENGLKIGTLKKLAKDKNPTLYTELFNKNKNKVSKESKDEIKNDNSFEIVKSNFELNHAKIQELSLFVRRKNDTNILMTRTQLTTSYEHLKFDKIMGVSNNGKPKIKEVSFINEWLINKDIKIYDNIGIYPKYELCPKNIFNMWIPFAMEKEINYVHKKDELQLILNHIKILCNHQTDVYDFIIKWTADMFQNPHIKNGVMPIFIALQGSGKNTFVELIKRMMGANKVFESSDPSRDVWGNFNSQMKECFFVHLEELSKKDMIEATGKVKALVTNPELTINQKGISQYSIHSYHRFISTTNSEDPIPTSKDDRRNFIIRCSDEKKGDTAYFNNLYNLLKDDNVIKTCFEYFKNLDISDFNIKVFPSTDYQNELKIMNESPIDHWLKSLVYENFNKTDDIELLGVDIFNKFEHWKKRNGFEKYEINSVKLGVRLKNMNIKGIHKGKHTKRGETKIFNIKELKEHYNIENVVKNNSYCDDDDDDKLKKSDLDV